MGFGRKCAHTGGAAMQNWRKTLAARVTLLLGLAAVGLMLWAIGGTQAGESAKSEGSAPTQNQAADAGGRLREGTALVNQPGYFKITGDRLTFYTLDGRRFGGLENQSLERVAKMVVESPEPLEWSVSGSVTEYQGANYLLVQRVVLKSRPTRSSVR
jgi:hypothetical protein